MTTYNHAYNNPTAFPKKPYYARGIDYKTQFSIVINIQRGDPQHKMEISTTPRKTIHIVMIIVLILITSALKTKIQTGKAQPNFITVPDDYTKIQWAIENATAGDTVYVRSGIYFEHLKVNKPLTLIGESKESTVIDGNRENKTIIEVTASNVVISEFTVQNTSRRAGTSYAGIKVSSRACNITDNFVTKTKVGIFVTSQRSRITENILRGNGHGIALHSSSEVTVEANNVSGNTVGISLALSFNNMIVGNSAVNSSTGGHGITLSSDSFNNTIRVNRLLNNYHGMWLSSSHNNSILENIIANNKLLGIELAGSSDNSFYHNNFVNNGVPPLAPSIKHIVIDGASICLWDGGYPSGGNYWHDYTAVDEKSGPNQDQLGSDEIWDIPYTINSDNRDNYPSVTPYSDISGVIPDEEPSSDLTAEAGQDQTVKVGWSVDFDATGSTGNIASYEWDFGDGTKGTGATYSHMYNATGTYDVVLTVRDGAGNSDTDKLTVTVIADTSSFRWVGVFAGVTVIVLVTALFWKRRSKSKKRLRKARSSKRR